MSRTRKSRRPGRPRKRGRQQQQASQPAEIGAATPGAVPRGIDARHEAQRMLEVDLPSAPQRRERAVSIAIVRLTPSARDQSLARRAGMVLDVIAARTFRDVAREGGLFGYIE